MHFIDDPCYKDSGNADVKCVVLHHTASAELSARNTLWGDAEVSIHYLIGKTGNVYYGVRLGKAAWHCYPSRWNGLTNLNAYSIGIELSNLGDGNDPYTAEQLQALDEVLSIHIRPLYGDLPIVRHRDISWFIGKIDPSDNFPWSNYQGGIAQVKQRMTRTGVQLQEDNDMPSYLMVFDGPGDEKNKTWLVNFASMTKTRLLSQSEIDWLKGFNDPGEENIIKQVKGPQPHGELFREITRP